VTQDPSRRFLTGTSLSQPTNLQDWAHEGLGKEFKFLESKKRLKGWIQESLNEKMSVSYGGYY
jgi:hypothetical protein